MFITIEGGEGSGKTSALKLIVDDLAKNGFVILQTREPGGTPIAEQIRSVILDPENTALDARAEALLYAASRRQHLVEKVWPAEREGKVVICDRFIDSSLVYQGIARGIGIKEVLDMNMFATEGDLPELSIFFDIEPKVGFERIAKNKNREINRLDLEALSFHEKVREGFRMIAKMYPERCVIIDASQPLQNVVQNVLKIIYGRLKV